MDLPIRLAGLSRARPKGEVMRSLRVIASAHTITPLTECRYPTANGDWFTFTYQATSLDSGGAFIPAARNTVTEKNILSIAAVTQGAGQQAWIEQFYNGTSEYAFAVWAQVGDPVTWTVKHKDQA